MADEKRPAQAVPVVVPEPTLAQAMAKIAELMERQSAYNEFAIKNSPRRKKTMAEYLKEHPRKRLLRPVFQNGRPVNPRGLSLETIKKLDTLATGHYCDGLIDVVRVKDGINGVNSRIHIMYNNKSEMQKMEIYIRFPSFTKMVNDILADMAAQEIKPVLEAVADPIEEEYPEALDQ